jgi:hypothetical protein
LLTKVSHHLLMFLEVIDSKDVAKHHGVLINQQQQQQQQQQQHPLP